MKSGKTLKVRYGLHNRLYRLTKIIKVGCKHLKKLGLGSKATTFLRFLQCTTTKDETVPISALKSNKVKGVSKLFNQ
jgi:hypothetical protein